MTTKGKLTNDEANAMLQRLVDEGHLIDHGGFPEQDIPLSYSRARKPSGAPYPEETRLDGPDPVDADAARAPFNKNFRLR